VILVGNLAQTSATVLYVDSNSAYRTHDLPFGSVAGKSFRDSDAPKGLSTSRVHHPCKGESERIPLRAYPECSQSAFRSNHRGTDGSEMISMAATPPQASVAESISDALASNRETFHIGMTVAGVCFDKYLVLSCGLFCSRRLLACGMLLQKTARCALHPRHLPGWTECWNQH
jgi:hypothetical protein